MANERIFIADDDSTIALELERNLLSLGYEVGGRASSGAEAVSMVQLSPPDLILMDISMPGSMDGIQAAERIRPFEIPLMFVTGMWDGPVLERAKQTEPCGYILKPFEPADLKTGIEIGLHRYRSQQQRQAKAKAQAAATRLTGLLPICCYCKKIKEPSDRWTQIEAYIMQRTDASFSHGMCPECFENVKRQLEAAESGSTGSASLVLG